MASAIPPETEPECWGLSSIKPNDTGDELDSGQKVPRSLLVAGGDCPKLLKPGEEILDQMARAIKLPVIVARRGSVGRSGRRWLEDPFIGVERLVGDQRISRHGGQQVVRTQEVVCLAAGQEQADRVAQRVGQGMDLGARPAARAPDRLVLAGFF